MVSCSVSREKTFTSSSMSTFHRSSIGLENRRKRFFNSVISSDPQGANFYNRMHASSSYSGVFLINILAHALYYYFMLRNDTCFF